MRSFEERRTEIFNRSDKRIAKRKKIYSAVTVCVLSFVLVIAIVPTVIMRKSDRECTNINDGATTGAVTDIDKNAADGNSHPDKIIILNADSERLKDYYVDGAAAYIANLFADNDADNNKHDIPAKEQDVTTKGDSAAASGSKVIIESFDGTYQYSLVGNFVISSDGKEVFLDENELSQLKTKLGIA